MKRFILIISALCVVASAKSMSQNRKEPKVNHTANKTEKEEIKIVETDDPQFNESLEEFKTAASDEYMRNDDKFVENKKTAKKEKEEKQHLALNSWGALKWPGAALALTAGIGIAIFMSKKKKKSPLKKKSNSIRTRAKTSLKK